MSIKQLEVSAPEYSPAKTQFVTIHSSYLDARHDISLYNAYSTKPDIPVILFLHGVYGNHWVWMNLGGIHQVYDALQNQGLEEFLLVMPSDGGLKDGSAYLPLGQTGDYEKWIIDDVIQAVKQVKVPYVTDKSRWYISGLSMGGYGALRLGVKYPEQFSAISAHSSITRIEDMAQFVNTPLSFYDCANANETNILYWAGKNAAALPPIRFDCGTDDPLLASNQWLNRQFLAFGIDHMYQEYPGAHQWSYWHEHVAKSFTWFSNIEKSHKKR
ncbi:putative esterase [Paraglaciecola sp. T6c]|uniref:alpha/beta hydrolase n=1 Tax=Pseudoalteromonas atlantica (strain T6c / ATCC BAA-1087) TaxID=3042615 RepID=UPI0000DA6DF6|nr:alpha/beta fold hydrolase [Paraglaciecola sp. T6c]ABG40825.1 putative esterase [Paraglaciecola sp. T6c]